MEFMNCIIIDDELNAIKTLEWELNDLKFPVKVLEKFTDVENAVEFLTYNAGMIDLIFLDIQMPTMNGFEFLEKFKARNFEVIFVTAYDNFAIKAIKEAALDYILKPVEQNELTTAVKKVLTKKKYEVKDKDGLNKISIPVENRLVFLDPQDIIYCKSDGNYSEIFTIKNDFLISKTLKFVEELLPKSIFYRIHQSYIVNLKKIKAYDKSTNYVILTNKMEFPVSRSKRKDFLERL